MLRQAVKGIETIEKKEEQQQITAQGIPSDERTKVGTVQQKNPGAGSSDTPKT